MNEISVHVVSCRVCSNVAMIGADENDRLYFLCLMCDRATPLEFIQEEIKKGGRLRRIHPDRN